MFYGPTAVKSQEEQGEYIALTLENDKVVVIGKSMAPTVLTEEATDLTKLRENRVHPAASDVLGQILKWNLNVDEMEYLFTLVVTSFNQNMDKATDMLWNANRQERTVKMVDEVLKGLKTNGTGTA